MLSLKSTGKIFHAHISCLYLASVTRTRFDACRCAISIGLSEAKENPAAVIHGGAMTVTRYRSRGSQSAMWVEPSSAGCSSLTRRQRTQFGPNSGAPSLRLR
jgi:hypothetical protein